MRGQHSDGDQASREEFSILVSFVLGEERAYGEKLKTAFVDAGKQHVAGLECSPRDLPDHVQHPQPGPWRELYREGCGQHEAVKRDAETSKDSHQTSRAERKREKRPCPRQTCLVARQRTWSFRNSSSILGGSESGPDALSALLSSWRPCRQSNQGWRARMHGEGARLKDPCPQVQGRADHGSGGRWGEFCPPKKDTLKPQPPNLEM